MTSEQQTERTTQAAEGLAMFTLAPAFQMMYGGKSYLSCSTCGLPKSINDNCIRCVYRRQKQGWWLE